MAGSSNLTPFELQIMQILWTRGASTVADVQAALHTATQDKPAYTTVQTMLNILHRKGKADRSSVAGTRAFRYKAAVSRERAAGSTVRDLVQRMFGGDPNALLLTLLDTRQVTRADLTRLSAELAARDPESQTPAPVQSPVPAPASSARSQSGRTTRKPKEQA
jgi:BlaI family penicillinase repressor